VYNSSLPHSKPNKIEQYIIDISSLSTFQYSPINCGVIDSSWLLKYIVILTGEVDIRNHRALRREYDELILKFESEECYYNWAYLKCVERLKGIEGDGGAVNAGNSDGLVELNYSDNVES
jgi:hypothetical protein